MGRADEKLIIEVVDWCQIKQNLNASDFLGVQGYQNYQFLRKLTL